MKIKYWPCCSSFPALESVKPSIPVEHRELAKLAPPPALPLHCKPWTDASSYGLLVSFPYDETLSVARRIDGSVVVDVSPGPTRHAHTKLVQTFSETHFGLASGYYFKTEPGIGIYTNALPHGYQPKATILPGLVETWWYPKSLFLVFKLPEPGDRIVLQRGDPLGVLMPIMCGQVVGELMTPDEIRGLKLERALMHHYLERHPELRWTSAEGETFSHIYKVFARKHAARRRVAAVQNGTEMAEQAASSRGTNGA
jgi:hypothetical protein